MTQVIEPETISCDICGKPVPITDIYTNDVDETICLECFNESQLFASEEYCNQK